MDNTEKIIVQEYDPIWAKQFKDIKSVIELHLGALIIGIEHVGSTSIPGMAAKPIIDLDIIIDNDRSVLNKVISSLDELGYNHVGDLGITGRDAFKRRNATTPNSATIRQWFKHNLYVCTIGSMGLSNHINFRDYLLKHPGKVSEYSELKLRLANMFPYDIDRYIDGKTDFIVEVLSQTGMNDDITKQIEKENKLK